MTAQVLREMGVRGPQADLIMQAAHLHDVGKAAIPASVLLKNGRLTPAEWQLMLTHPDRGADMLLSHSVFAEAARIVRHHHERWDGLGYPDGLSGTDIPFGSRVIAVADSYDAMTSDRPYRAAMSDNRARYILRGGRGTLWDPAVVDAFLRSTAGRQKTSLRPDRVSAVAAVPA